MRRRAQTLITGFEAFGRVTSNPSERIVRALSYDCIAGQEITGYVLPVSYTYVFDWLRAILEVGGRDGQPFDNILHIGVAMGSAYWRVERFARNQCGKAPDGAGLVPPNPWIVEEGAPLFAGDLPVEAMASDLQAKGLPAQVSNSAGDYLCNYLYYRSLAHLDTLQNPPRAGFLHIPADPASFDSKVTSAPVFSFEQHLEAARSALTTLSEHPLNRGETT